MSWDIYGNPLQREDATRQRPDCEENERYLGQAQEYIKALESQCNDLLAALEAIQKVNGPDFNGWHGVIR